MQASTPSVATLLPGGAENVAPSMAQRLSQRTGRPVLCSCTLPTNNPMLQAVAERRLIQELTTFLKEAE